VLPFRYLIVSLAVVILALAAGILLGGTVIDPALQARLTQQVRDLDSKINGYRNQVGQLENDVSQWERFGESTLKPLVAGRLAGEPVVIVADQNVDPSASQEARQVLTDAGATLVGVIEVLPTMALTEAGDRSTLAGLLGLDPNNPPDDLVSQAATAVATRLEGVPPAQDDLLTSLSDGGFIALPQLGPNGVEGIAGPGEGVVVLAGGPKEPAVDPAEFLLPLLRALDAADTAAPTVAAEPTDTVTLFVQDVRQSDLSGRVSTVDDLDQVFGRFALAVALHDQLASPGRGSDYGVKAGASARFPSP
jgi:hypothetical protein